MVELGVKCAIITLGEKGVVASTIEETITVPSFLVPVIDTTGAGDSFMGAFAVAWAEHQPLSDALRFASAGAAD